VNKTAKLLNRLVTAGILKFDIFTYKSNQRSQNFVRQYERDKEVDRELFETVEENKPEPRLFLQCLFGRNSITPKGRLVRGRSSLEKNK